MVVSSRDGKLILLILILYGVLPGLRARARHSPEIEVLRLPRVRRGFKILHALELLIPLHLHIFLCWTVVRSILE